MARPRKEIDWDEFDKLCGMQCTCREIAGWFEVSEDTIERACIREKKLGFAEYAEQKRNPGKIGIRRKQYEIAMKGNVGMLIWLGKQYLGQADKLEEKIQTTGDQTITVNVGWADELQPDDAKKNARADKDPPK